MQILLFFILTVRVAGLQKLVALCVQKPHTLTLVGQLLLVRLMFTLIVKVGDLLFAIAAAAHVQGPHQVLTFSGPHASSTSLLISEGGMSRTSWTAFTLSRIGDFTKVVHHAALVVLSGTVMRVGLRAALL